MIDDDPGFSHAPIALRRPPGLAGCAVSLVYLHGRGTDETEGARAAAAFGPAAVVAFRAPYVERAGFAWFRNRGVGTAIPESLDRAVVCVEDWLAREPLAGGRWLCGFSNGAAMAATLMLRRPEHYRGLIMIGGCLAEPPPVDRARLAGRPVFFCSGASDRVIPRDKTLATLAYLRTKSAAALTEHEHSGGHEPTAAIWATAGAWFAAASASPPP